MALFKRRGPSLTRLKARRDALESQLRHVGKDQKARDRFSAEYKRIDSAIKAAESGSWLHPDD